MTAEQEEAERTFMIFQTEYVVGLWLYDYTVGSRWSDNKAVLC